MGTVRARRPVLVLAVAVLAGCGGGAVPPAQRTVVDESRGYRIVLPDGWVWFGTEARSHGGSLLTIEARSLAGADRQFVAGLPGSIVPQLEAWTLYYYSVVGTPTRREATLGGQPGLEISYPVRIRESGPPSRADYWVVRHGLVLYIIRATYPPERLATDGPAVAEAIRSWGFVGTSGPAAQTSSSVPNLAGLWKSGGSARVGDQALNSAAPSRGLSIR